MVFYYDEKKTYHIYKEVKIFIIISLYLTIDEIIEEIRANPTKNYYKVVTVTPNSVNQHDQYEHVKINNEFVLNTQFICHRINTIEELKKIPPIFGVEIDIRDTTGRENDTIVNTNMREKNQLVLAHDPYPTNNAEPLDDYLQEYKRRNMNGPIILNVKSERIEPECFQMVKKHDIQDFFFLDSSFPMIFFMNKKNDEKTNRFACRISEYEPIECFLYLCRENMATHVWIDCFTKQPLTKEMETIIFNSNKTEPTKICIVSPELQGQPGKIEEYRSYFIENKIVPKFICCKLERIIEWI